MDDNTIEVVRLKDVVTFHRKVDGYSNGYCLSGENNVYIYLLSQSMFFGVAHVPTIDRMIGVQSLKYSFTPKHGNANYLALLLNSAIMRNIIAIKMREQKRVTISSVLSPIILPYKDLDVQKAVGFLEIIRQFLMQNEEYNLFTISYPSLKAGLFSELSGAIADELLLDEHISYYHLTFVQHWVEIYKDLPILEYTTGSNQMLSEVALLQCIEMAFDKLTEARSELYANLMRYRIVKTDKK